MSPRITAARRRYAWIIRILIYSGSLLLGGFALHTDNPYHALPLMGALLLLLLAIFLGEYLLGRLNVREQSASLRFRHTREVLRSLKTLLVAFDGKGRLVDVYGVAPWKTPTPGEKDICRLFDGHEQLRRVRATSLGGKRAEETVRLEEDAFQVIGVPLKDGALCVLSDVTGLMRTQEERSFLQSRLEQATRMEALGTLAGGFAHDFNNILFSAMGFNEMAMDFAQEGTRLHTCLSQVAISFSRARELVEQISLFSGKPMGERQRLNLGILIKSLAKRLVREHIGRLKLHLDIDPQTEPVSVDPAAIHLVLFHLIDNAVRAMDGSPGTLTCSLAPATGREDMEVFIRIAITDTGVGMNQETLRRIFDPYFTTRPPGEGMGLGLATVYGIVSQHGGWVEVDSAPGRGSTFEVFLPRASDDCPEAAGGDPADIPKGSGRILIVDDEPQIETLLRITLESFGYTVTSTTSPETAWEQFAQSPETFDLLITDHLMPGMSGEELASRVHALAQDIPILMLTGHSVHLPMLKKKAGITDILLKPTSKRELATKVRCSLNKGTHDTDTPDRR